MKTVAVLDVGKTISKLTLWGSEGQLLAREARPNARVEGPGYLALDVVDIGAWLLTALTRFNAIRPIDAIIPVAHGAAAVLVRDGEIATPPMDYENPIPSGEGDQYDAQRDPFALTGSPRLPDGLNLGAQLNHLEAIASGAVDGATLLLWPQYWAWLLSGVAACELTSLGCHTDLWRPIEQRPSELAMKRGWASLLPPLRRAGDCLGHVRPEIAKQTGLPLHTQIHCGLHDSNAALVAARAFPEMTNREATIVSTGTWFVAMRTPESGSSIDLEALPEDRDCLVNLDADGAPVPSSRFMGGREIETLTGSDTARIDVIEDQPELLNAATDVIRRGTMVLPTFAPGVGPYPSASGRWTGIPQGEAERRAAISLYAALVADTALELIGARERILVEGRFAQAEVFVRALASLRPDSEIYVAGAENDVSFGALHVLDARLKPGSFLRRVRPLDCDLEPYTSDWRECAQQLQRAG